jgi:hypothetical protein
MIAVFDAKYHYGFWRPITAIRNGDSDGNDDTAADAAWIPFIETPMHPEYPCAHCIVAATVGSVLLGELGTARCRSETTSPPPRRGGAGRRSTTSPEWRTRIYDGVHYRNSTEVGTAMGRQIGALAARFRLRPD